MYKDVLVVNKSCIGKQNDGLYYVRIVDQDGNFMYEQNVELGFENGKYVCVTGIEEGTFCDGGYSTFEEIMGDNGDSEEY